MRAGLSGSAENGEKRPPGAQKLNGSNTRRLFQRRIDGRELGLERRTKAIDHGDNGKGDAGSDETVFDRGSTRLIGPELSNNLLHSIFPYAREPDARVF